MKVRTVIWIVGITIIICLIPTSIMFCQNQRLKKRNILLAGEVEISQKKFSDSLIRAKTEKSQQMEELRELAKEQNSDIKRIENGINSLGGRLEAVAQTGAKTETIVINHHSSDLSEPSKTEVPSCSEDGRPIDIHGYTKRIETINVEDSNGMRVADVSFAAAERNPWAFKVHGITYKINNTIGRTRDGQIILHTELIAQNQKTQPDRIFRIDGVESRILQAPNPPPEFDWWDPRIYLGAGLGATVHPEVHFSASINLGFSPFSYGNLSVLGLSAGYDAFNNSFIATLHPILYNIGAHLPMLSDLFLSPYVSIDSRSSVSIGLGISTRL